MQIANPIYDVVFKFLMEDSRAAKTLLSALIRQEITELSFLPQELSIDIGKSTKSKTQDILEKYSLTIYRMDFSAKIQTEEGEKQIIIELQKARLREDITRFRSYLGKQYQKTDLFVWIQESKRYKAGIPIYAIYFLGYELKKYKNIPIILVENQVTDRFTEKILDKREPFISSLFHEGMIVNIPALKGKRRDDLEKLLSIFDQSNREENYHILNVNEKDFEGEKSLIIRRLQAASRSKELREKMLAEDSALSEFQEIELELENERKLRSEAEKQLEEEKQQKELANKQLTELQNKLLEVAKNMLSQGGDIASVAQILGISEENIQKHLEK